MAELGSYYPLCPLIHQCKFLGVSNDSSNRFVVVTLSKNIIIRYDLSDQKMVNWWSTTNKLGAPVVFDRGLDAFMGVFSSDKVGLWVVDTVDINKVKKRQFGQPLHCLLTAPGIAPVLVYKDGSFGFYQEEIEHRKKRRSSETRGLTGTGIQHASLLVINSVYHVVLFSSDDSDQSFVQLTAVDSTTSSFSLQLKREDAQLKGYAVNEFNNGQLLTAWSDGKLFGLDLTKHRSQEDFPGTLVCNLKLVSCEQPVVLTPLSADYLAVYGAKPNGEGAEVGLINIKLGVVQRSQSVKVHRAETGLWRCGDGHLMFLGGDHLCVVRYHLGASMLAPLLGSKVAEDPAQAPAFLSWQGSGGVKVTQQAKEPSSPLAVRVKQLQDQGMSQQRVCEEVLPGLLEAEDEAGVLELLGLVKEVPEEQLLAALGWAAGSASSPARPALVGALVSRPPAVCPATLAQARTLPLATVLRLLDQVRDLLAGEPPDSPHPLVWAALLIDSHYQQFILSKDQAVRDTTSALKNTVVDTIESVKQYRELYTLVHALNRPKRQPVKPLPSNYKLTKINLYS